MRAVLSSLNFTIPVLVAVAIATVFAFVLEAPLEIVMAMLVLGAVTAFTEYRMRSSAKPGDEGET